MNACYESGHQSVLEFADFTFHIEGVSRALLAQLTRHRHSSFAVRSQRYCVEDGFKFVIPKSIKDDASIESEYLQVMNQIKQFYSHALDHGVPAEDARYMLPNACFTNLEVKMNGRALIHFCNERMCSRAQWEIRELAYKMKSEVENVSPQFAKYLRPKCEIHTDFPMCPEHKSCGKHPRIKDIYSNT